MSATLCLTMALFGANPYSGGHPASGSHSYSAPYYSGYSHSGYSGYGYSGYGYGGYGHATTGWRCVSPGYGGYTTRGYGMQSPRTAYRQTAPAAPQRQVVNMTDRARFEPAQITVNLGDTVEWRNVSRHPHTVTADPELTQNPARVVLPEGADPFHSEEVASGGRYTYTFDQPGIYYYVCLPHEDQGMVGIVVVNPRSDERRQPDAGAAEPRGRGRDY